MAYMLCGWPCIGFGGSQIYLAAVRPRIRGRWNQLRANKHRSLTHERQLCAQGSLCEFDGLSVR